MSRMPGWVTAIPGGRDARWACDAGWACLFCLDPGHGLETNPGQILKMFPRAMGMRSTWHGDSKA